MQGKLEYIGRIPVDSSQRLDAIGREEGGTSAGTCVDTVVVAAAALFFFFFGYCFSSRHSSAGPPEQYLVSNDARSWITNGLACLIFSVQSHFDVSSLLVVVFVAQFMAVWIRYGLALHGLPAILLCLRPLSPPAPLVTGKLASVICHCVAERGSPLVLGLFVGASELLWLSGDTESCQ